LEITGGGMVQKGPSPPATTASVPLVPGASDSRVELTMETLAGATVIPPVVSEV
jgi:hypothetical protein